MRSQEQADRTARNVLELVQARRQITAVRALCTEARADVMRLGYLDVDDVEAALDTKPAPTSFDPKEVPS